MIFVMWAEITNALECGLYSVNLKSKDKSSDRIPVYMMKQRRHIPNG